MQTVLPLPGDIVWIRQRRWRVERSWRDRHVVRLDVASRDRRLTFLAPFDQPVIPSGRCRLKRVRRQHAAARAAGLIAHSPDPRLPMAAITARVEIFPHQFAPVLATIAGHTRLLLADDVGLGKTIQAGLIVAELLRREPAPRVLLLVPSPLRDQWADELRSRFSIAVTIADRSSLDAMSRAGAYGENPWRRAGVWLASPDFLKQRHVIQSLPSDPWDLLVIDEAHAACGDSDRFETCQAVARRSRRVVLLTATPHSGDDTRYTRLLELGRLPSLALFPKDEARLLVFRRTRRDVGLPSDRRIRWHHVKLSDAEGRTLAALESYERAVLSSVTPESSEHAQLLLTVLRKRALSTFAALSCSISRRLGWLGDSSDEAALDWVQPRLAFEDLTDEAADEERAALTAQTGMDCGQERAWLRQMRGLADEAARRDSKVQRLVELIHRTKEPIVVFTEFRDSLDAVARRLHLSRAIAVLHGTQERSERRANLRRFLDGTASVLLATDVAGQGLNLQSRSRWVASLELPWNPARLEQRIGRVDRLGQKRVPHLTLIVARHEAETGLLRHLARRVLTARTEFAADVLPSLLPGEAAVRATLLRRPLVSSPTSVTSSTSAAHVPAGQFACWRRTSSAVARALIQRRRLVQRWQAATEPSARTLWTHGGGVLLCSVPLLNERDELVARLPLAVRAHFAASELSRDQDALTAAVQRAVDRHLARVLRKMARRWLNSCTRLSERERAIALFIRQTGLPAEVQHCLFDNRANRALQRAAEDHAHLSAASARMVERWNDGASLKAGPISLEITWIPRS